MPADDGFDLAQLDSETANFYLVIETAQKLDPPIRQMPRQVTGAIKPPSGSGIKRIRNKLFGSQFRAMQISPDDSRATY